MFVKRLPGKFQPLPLEKGQSTSANTLKIHNSQTDRVGLEIDWSQHWAGCASLLMTIRPKCIFINQSAADLTLVYDDEFCVIQSEQATFAPSALLVSY